MTPFMLFIALLTTADLWVTPFTFDPDSLLSETALLVWIKI